VLALKVQEEAALQQAAEEAAAAAADFNPPLQVESFSNPEDEKAKLKAQVLEEASRRAEEQNLTEDEANLARRKALKEAKVKARTEAEEIRQNSKEAVALEPTTISQEEKARLKELALEEASRKAAEENLSAEEANLLKRKTLKEHKQQVRAQEEQLRQRSKEKSMPPMEVQTQQQQFQEVVPWKLEEAAEPKAATRTIFLPMEVKGARVLVKEAGQIWRAVAPRKSPCPCIGYRLSKNFDDKLEGQQLFYGDTIAGVDDGDGWVRCEVPLTEGPTARSMQNHTGMVFLPIEISGIRVLQQEEHNCWRATNKKLKTKSTGIGFRKSKNMADKLEGQQLNYGDVVNGIEAGEGWLQCEMLPSPTPMALKGSPVSPKRLGRGATLIMNASVSLEDSLAQSALETQAEKPLTRTVFLPMEAGGVRILVAESSTQWRAVQPRKSRSAGVGFRRSKRLDDKLENQQLNYGEVIQGTDAGNGWLQCELEVGVRTAFLPMKVQGVQVLLEEAPHIWRATKGKLNSKAPGIGFRRSKRLEDRVEDEILNYGEATYGVQEGDWLRCQIKVQGEIAAARESSRASLGASASSQVSSSSREVIVRSQPAPSPEPFQEALAIRSQPAPSPEPFQEAPATRSQPAPSPEPFQEALGIRSQPAPSPEPFQEVPEDSHAAAERSQPAPECFRGSWKDAFEPAASSSLLACVDAFEPAPEPFVPSPVPVQERTRPEPSDVPIPTSEENGCVLWDVVLKRESIFDKYGFTFANRVAISIAADSEGASESPSIEVLIVKSIMADGLLLDWNWEHPDAQVCSGDRIMMVNDKMIIQEMKQALREETITIKLCRYPMVFHVELQKTEAQKKLGFKFDRPSGTNPNPETIALLRITEVTAGGLMDESNRASITNGMPQYIVTPGMIIEAVNEIESSADAIAEELRRCTSAVKIRIRRRNPGHSQLQTPVG